MIYHDLLVLLQTLLLCNVTLYPKGKWPPASGRPYHLNVNKFSFWSVTKITEPVVFLGGLSQYYVL